MAQLDLPSAVAVPENLSNEQRQLALDILQSRDHPLALADLATDMVRARNPDTEADPDPETVRRLRLALYHTHVPKLADAGLVAFDPSERTVRCAGAEPHLLECSSPNEEAEL